MSCIQKLASTHHASRLNKDGIQLAVVYLQYPNETIPVHSIFCIGRNYAAHAKELNNPVPASPIIFLKPATTIIHSGDWVILPPQSQSVHHEVEVVLLIGKTGKNISESAALDYVKGYGVGVDITARDIQQKAKEKGHPWSVAKGFDTFAPVSDFIAAERITDPGNLDLQLSVNGEVRQIGNTRDMLFPIPTLIKHLSAIFTLSPGDLIFTGTPQGVGPFKKGDKLHATLGQGLAELRVNVK